MFTPPAQWNLCTPFHRGAIYVALISLGRSLFNRDEISVELISSGPAPFNISKKWSVANLTRAMNKIMGPHNKRLNKYSHMSNHPAARQPNHPINLFTLSTQLTYPSQSTYSTFSQLNT